jgi:hypothetical protein
MSNAASRAVEAAPRKTGLRNAVKKLRVLRKKNGSTKKPVLPGKQTKKSVNGFSLVDFL